MADAKVIKQKNRVLTWDNRVVIDDTDELLERMLKNKVVRVRGIIAVITFFALNVTAFSLLYKYMEIERLPFVLLVTFAGFVTADFFSGCVHWYTEAWGRINTSAFFETTLSLPLQNHHLNPLRCTRIDFITNWGDVCFILSGCMLIPVSMLLTLSLENIHTFYYLILYVSVTTAIGSTSNQAHKWAHLRDLPIWVKLLQKVHILLPSVHHHFHHDPPYLVKYCITNGLANYPLDYIDFWKKVELVIAKITGVNARDFELKQNGSVINDEKKTE